MATARYITELSQSNQKMEKRLAAKQREVQQVWSWQMIVRNLSQDDGKCVCVVRVMTCMCVCVCGGSEVARSPKVFVLIKCPAKSLGIIFSSAF